jgi:Ca2+-binding RTX toxin-like protein
VTAASRFLIGLVRRLTVDAGRTAVDRMRNAWFSVATVRTASKPATFRSRRSLRGILPLVLASSLLWPAAVALAAPASCSFDGGTGIVSVAAATHGEVATISRLGDAIALDGVACETATVTNTDLISVAFPDDPDSDMIVIDLSGGLLAPGATDEGDGSSEIEIEITGGDGSFDTLRIVGTSGPDAFATSFFAVNLNADEAVRDADVAVDDTISLELIGGDGGDTLSADPFSAFGRTTLLGGEGDDRLSGRGGDDDVLDAGPGRDVADYSWVNEVHLVWDEDGNARFQNLGDVVANVEVAVLTDGGDSVSYVGDATGVTWLGDSFDEVNVIDWSPLVSPDDRIIHGGPGEFDSIRFDLSPPQHAYVELSRRTLGGTWPATYRGFEFVFGSSSDDWFLVEDPGVYPTIVGGFGEDTIDLRNAVEAFDVTLGQDTFGDGPWLDAPRFETVFGSAYDDVLLGPDSAPGTEEDAVTFYGFGGNDFLRGWDEADLLHGGKGMDTLWGLDGADTLFGGFGDDALRGGSGPDELRGGGGDDLLVGGPGTDACVGGAGSDRVDCER